LIGLWGIGKLPVERLVQEVESTRARLAGLVQVLGPATSTGASTAASPTPQMIAQAAETAVPIPSPTEQVLPEEDEVIEGLPPELEATEPSATAPSTSEPASTVATAGTSQAATAAATLTPEPTATSTPTLAPTATSAPPTPTATRPAPTAAPATDGGRTTYRVQAGDTLSTIAARFGISWEALAAANNITARTVLQIGQELIIPLSGGAAPAVATPTRRPTPTPLAPTSTPQPLLPAPVLVSPGDQTPLAHADALIEIVWEQVDGFAPGSQYQIIVRWVEQGTPQEHYWFTTATSSRVPLWLWGKADQPARQYTWLVRVVLVTTDGQGGERVIPLSPPSASRVFYWN
jgi:LysM repeat protein